LISLLNKKKVMKVLFKKIIFGEKKIKNMHSKQTKNEIDSKKIWKKGCFQTSRLSWVYIHKESIHYHRKSKLMLRKDGSFKFFEGENDYKVDL